jgi:Fe-S-cluster-containing dehydrogenase component
MKGWSSMSAKIEQRKFVSVDPSKCTGCGICELACIQEKNERSPLRSRIRIVRMTPMFNFALSCRVCKDPKCVKACPEKAIQQAENTGVLMIDEKKCKGCDWCVQACDYGGLIIQSDTGIATVCDLCGGTPQCVEFCPEEALEIVDSDEAAEKRFNDALSKLSGACEELVTTVKNRDWKPLLAAAEKRSEKVSEKLVALNKRASEKKQK